MSTKALIIIDVQKDFLPGGALGVPGGHEIIYPIKRLVKGEDYKLVLASRDWHPYTHMSFINNGGIWPDHCVMGTDGSKIDDDILELDPVVVTKGTNPDREAYSAFDGFVHVENSPILSSYLDREKIEAIDVVGLALDYCVLATALGGAVRGYVTTVLLDLCRPVDYLTGMKAIEQLAAKQVILKNSNYSE